MWREERAHVCPLSALCVCEQPCESLLSHVESAVARPITHVACQSRTPKQQAAPTMAHAGVVDRQEALPQWTCV
jgi:hypothetical protein